MKFIPQAIPEVMLIEPDVFGDDRGFFMETWRASTFCEQGIDGEFVQDNQSRSVKNTLRGLHYQIANPQGKLVRVIAGEVFDVAVDLRQSSSYFGQWAGAILSEKNRHQLWVPPGFAHGFYVLSNFAEFVYKCTNYYAPHHERCLRWDDPDVAVEWPLIDQEGGPLLSRKDKTAGSLGNIETFD